MTTNEIIATARRKVLETTDEIVSADAALLYANQAYIEVYKQVVTGNQVTSQTVACTAGVCAIPATYGRMYTNAIDQNGREFVEVSIADFLNDDIVGYNYTVENGAIKVSEDDVTTLTLRFYAKPEALSDTVNPTVDEYFHEVIVYGVVWRMHEDLQDEELSTYYQNKFGDELKRRMSNQSNYEESNQRGGQMFTDQRLI